MEWHIIQLQNCGKFKNYVKTAWRHLVKNRIHSTINVSGFAVGIAVVLLVGLWIRDEVNFDTYNKNYKTIAQIARKEISKSDIYIADGNNHFPIPLAGELRRNYSDLFRHVSLTSERSSHGVSFNESRRSVTGVFADKDFTHIFTQKFIRGSAASFADPNSILLSHSAAQSLFGKMDPVGKVVRLDNAYPLKVIGVYEDLPINNSFSGVDFFCPFDELIVMYPDLKHILNEWNNSSFFVYADVQPGMSDERISSVIKDVYWSKIKDNPNQAPGSKVQLFLHPMKDWHLRSEWKNGVQAGGQIQIVRLFGIIGVFVLLLACINFMNLSTARAGRRAKEVGVRKTMGSQRSQLVKQFLSEALLMVLLASFLGIFLVVLSLPWFNSIASKNIKFPYSNPQFWLYATIFILVTSLIAGSYPALYISSFKPVKVLKGVFKAGGSAPSLRKGLLAMQFIISMVIITGTIVVYRQIQLAKDRPVGYNRIGLIQITVTSSDLHGKYDLLQKEVLSSGGAVAMARSSSSATENNYFDDHFEWEGKDLTVQNQSFALTAVTPDYGKAVGWQFVEGRDFSRDLASDKLGVILNEAAVMYTGLRHPVGKNLRWNGKLFTVVGVIKDMVKGSPYKAVQHGLFFMAPDIGPNITIRLNPLLSPSRAIGKIERIFKQLNPSSPFEYTFVDDEYAHLFASEQRIGTLSSAFAMLAILISCLGIFGMASFVAEQRAKEIGIRKVLGASAYGIWRLLTQDFLMVVLIAALIALPIAYCAAHNWLDGYEYRTNLSWWIFAVTGFGVLLITLLTVSFHVIKAAIANPVNKLRTE
ncbi:MAG TPA: ABC transporter permease [Puia sp.]|nr:ABC transporter permease [Puia sp.]